MDTRMLDIGKRSWVCTFLDFAFLTYGLCWIDVNCFKTPNVLHWLYMYYETDILSYVILTSFGNIIVQTSGSKIKITRILNEVLIVNIMIILYDLSDIAETHNYVILLFMHLLLEMLLEHGLNSQYIIWKEQSATVITITPKFSTVWNTQYKSQLYSSRDHSI